MKKIILAAVLVLTCAISASAGTFTGNTLLEKCHRAKTMSNAVLHQGITFSMEDAMEGADSGGVCSGFIGAISSVLYHDNFINGLRACISKGATISQVHDVVIIWLKANPAKRHLSAHVLVVKALSEAFPCKK